MSLLLTTIVVFVFAVWFLKEVDKKEREKRNEKKED